MTGKTLFSRRAWVPGVALATLAAVFAWVPEDPSGPVEAGNLTELPPKEEQDPGKRWEILGMEAAKEGKTLKNPFSLLHEERGNIPVAPEKPPRESKSTAASPPSSPQPSFRETAPPKPPEEKWRLQGIVSGEGNRLAIVSNGKETRSVAVGEQFGNFVVEAIEEDSLRFTGSSGEGRLQLPVF